MIFAVLIKLFFYIDLIPAVNKIKI